MDEKKVRGFLAKVLVTIPIDVIPRSAAILGESADIGLPYGVVRSTLHVAQ